MAIRLILSGPTPAAVLNEHERRLRNARPEQEEIVPVVLELIEAGRKALREHRSGDLALALHQLGAVTGWLEGFAESSRSRERVLGLLRERLPDVVSYAKQQVRADSGSKGGRARTVRRTPEWERWNAEYSRLEGEHPKWTRQRICAEVGKTARPRPVSWRTVDDRLHRLDIRTKQLPTVEAEKTHRTKQLHT